MTSDPPPQTRQHKPGKRAEQAARRWHEPGTLADLKREPLSAYTRAVAAVGAVPGFRANLEFVRVARAFPSCIPQQVTEAVEALYTALTAWGRRHGLPVRPGTHSLACEADALNTLENWAASPSNPVMVMTAPPLRGRDFDPDLADVPDLQRADAWARRIKAARRFAAAEGEREAEAERLRAARTEAGKAGRRAGSVPPEVVTAWRQRFAELVAGGTPKLAACRVIVSEAAAGGPCAWAGHVVKLGTVRGRVS